MTCALHASRCGALLEAMLAPRSGLGAFSLLGNSVLAEIDEALADALPGDHILWLHSQPFSMGKVAAWCRGPCSCSMTS